MIGLACGSMDLFGIGFSNIRMANSSNDYTYQYDYRINTFPEEVYLHEFLHTLERISGENNYEVPELHNFKNYGYEEERLVGLKKWYQDYMNSQILDKQTNQYVGINEKVYALKPPHKSNFRFPVELDFNEEPKNLLQEINTLLKVVTTVFKQKG